ncbi:MAG: response regulator [Myxococcales bacterium]|nr:response regulator [Myxococcales bacterium]
MASMRILVVDDDPAMAEFLVEQLGTSGCESVSAGGVDEAAELLAVSSFDLVLSDLHMPPKDGFELLALTRRNWPRTAVILMSAFPTSETKKQASEAGAAGFLSKPFSMDALWEALESLPRPL